MNIYEEDNYSLKRLGEERTKSLNHEDGGSLGQTLLIDKYENELKKKGYKLRCDIPNVEGFTLTGVYYFIKGQLVLNGDVKVCKTEKGTFTIPDFEYCLVWF